MKSTVFPTAMGWIGIAVSDAGLKRVTLPCKSAKLAREALGSDAGADDPQLGRLTRTIQQFIAGVPIDFSEKFDLTKCSDFQRAVLIAVSRIPYGKTRSYAEVAREVGRPRAARAVGRVMATNPLPLVVPCHRVLASNGALCGFGGGLKMKQQLLDMEKQAG